MVHSLYNLFNPIAHLEVKKCDIHLQTRCIIFLLFNPSTRKSEYNFNLASLTTLWLSHCLILKLCYHCISMACDLDNVGRRG